VLGQRSPETFRVFVHSSGATLDGIEAHVALIQAKDGTARPSDWVALAWPTGSLDSRGRYLTVDPSAFGVGEFDVIVQSGWTGYEGAKAAPDTRSGRLRCRGHRRHRPSRSSSLRTVSVSARTP
jgi:hypothetical protein